MAVPAPLRNQSSGSSIALVFYGKTNEPDDVWMIQILPSPHFSLQTLKTSSDRINVARDRKTHVYILNPVVYIIHWTKHFVADLWY